MPVFCVAVIQVHTGAKTCLYSCDRNKFVYKSWISFWKNEFVSFLRNKFVFRSWVSFKFIQVYWTKCVLEFLWYPQEPKKLITGTSCTTQIAHWWSGLWKIRFSWTASESTLHATGTYCHSQDECFVFSFPKACKILSCKIYIILCTVCIPVYQKYLSDKMKFFYSGSGISC
jgi:hypothetical protein